MKRRGFTLVELIMVVGIIGLLAAIAIPSFMRFNTKAKRSEVRANLRAGWIAERAFFQEKEKFSPFLGDLGFEPERGNRYAYAFAATPEWSSRDAASPPVLTPTTTGVAVDTFRFPGSLATPDCGVAAQVTATGGFLVTACGNIDRDQTRDGWSISSATRGSGTGSSATACHAGVAPAGEPCLDASDL